MMTSPMAIFSFSSLVFLIFDYFFSSFLSSSFPVRLRGARGGEGEKRGRGDRGGKG